MTRSQVWDGTAWVPLVIAEAIPSSVPPGMVASTVAAVAPTGWLFFGQTVVGADVLHPGLWAVAPAVWKVGSDLVLPDVEGASLRQQATNHGTVAGDNFINLTAEQLAAHTHSIAHIHPGPSHNHTIAHTHSIEHQHPNVTAGYGSSEANRVLNSKSGDASWGGLDAQIIGGSGVDWGSVQVNLPNWTGNSGTSSAGSTGDAGAGDTGPASAADSGSAGEAVNVDTRGMRLIVMHMVKT